MTLQGKSILLIISGGIAAYKSLELIRLLKKEGARVRCILTKGGAEFITPLSVASLSGEPVYSDLFSLKDETEMGHIRLSREADLIVVAPASANMIAKMAHGMADDLAAAALLASDKPVMICPAMNPMMWQHPATCANLEILEKRGIHLIAPDSGEMACGEEGEGRLPEAVEILGAISDFFFTGKKLSGLKALITSGPTYEPIDPVRFIGNRSSGKQGIAIARELAALGADVTLVTGPTSEKIPRNIKTIRIETAQDMLESCLSRLPCDIAVCAAAVADWAAETPAASKLKKDAHGTPPPLKLRRNEDILARIAQAGPERPALVIGFAAETEKLVEYARHKLERKKCDWIVANPVNPANPVFGAAENQVYFITSGSVEEWPRASKDQVARQLGERIVAFFDNHTAGREAAE